MYVSFHVHVVHVHVHTYTVLLKPQTRDPKSKLYTPSPDALCYQHPGIDAGMITNTVPDKAYRVPNITAL